MDSKVFDDNGSWLRNVNLMVSLQSSIPVRKSSLRTRMSTTHYSRTQFPWHEDFKLFKEQ